MRDLNKELLSGYKLFKRENDIIQWGIDRNIIGNNAQATFEGQQEKTRQEWQEWKENHTKDDIGDIFVTLVMGAAFKSTTITGCVSAFLQEYGLGSPEDYLENVTYNGHLLEENYLDDNLNKYLSTNNYLTFFEKVSLVIDSLNVNALKYGWTLEECIEVAWDDIKDRKGKMVHGMFIKQHDLDSLSEHGVIVVEESGKVYFQGEGRNISFNSYRIITDIFNKLSLEIGYFEDMKYLRTVGRI